MKSGSLRHQDNMLLHCLISYIHVTSWLSLTDTFQNGNSFTEMGKGSFWQGLRIKDQSYLLLARIDKQQANPLTSQQTPSLLESSAEMKGNIHVCSSWMMNKAM